MNNSNYTRLKESKTEVTKGYHGWRAETITTVGEQTYEIVTLKRSSGLIVSNAQPCQISTDGGTRVSLVTDMFLGNIQLIKEKGRATENTIRKQHLKALAVFDQKVESGEIKAEKKEEPEIGTILFTWSRSTEKGYEGNNHIVYGIEEGRFGKSYLTVEKDTLALSKKDHVRPYAEKFGIGTYFESDFKFSGSQDELNNLVIEAKEKQRKYEQDRKNEALLSEQLRKAKIEEGKKLVHVPEWAEAIIVADNYQNDSDSMTDYFETSINERHILAFSRTKRNNMNELRAAAENWEVSAQLLKEETTKETRNKGGYYLPEFYIGSERWHGWKINKEAYIDLKSESNKELLYIAAAEGRYHVPEQKTETTTKQSKSSTGDIFIEEYSMKAMVVRGDTKPVKEQLKKLGCKFNFRLKGGAGWIFPKNRFNEISAELNLNS